MHGLLLLFALIAFAYGLTVTSALAMLGCMLLALLLDLGWMTGLYRSRFARHSSHLAAQAALLTRRPPQPTPGVSPPPPADNDPA